MLAIERQEECVPGASFRTITLANLVLETRDVFFVSPAADPLRGAVLGPASDADDFFAVLSI